MVCDMTCTVFVISNIILVYLEVGNHWMIEFYRILRSTSTILKTNERSVCVMLVFSLYHFQVVEKSSICLSKSNSLLCVKFFIL